LIGYDALGAGAAANTCSSPQTDARKLQRDAVKSA
jgi:hypothetical protein